MRQDIVEHGCLLRVNSVEGKASSLDFYRLAVGSRGQAGAAHLAQDSPGTLACAELAGGLR